VQVNPEAFLDGTKEVFVPLDLQIRMQAALHEHTGAAKVDGFLDLAEDSLLVVDVALGVPHRPIKGAETAILGAEIRVIDVAIYDVRYHSVGVELAPDGVRNHTNTDQVIGSEQVQSFGAGCHETGGRIKRSS
jgi:hypothetical protein